MAVWLAGCVSQPPPPVGQYRVSTELAPVAIVFAPAQSRISPPQIATLHAIGREASAFTVPVVFAAGPLAQARSNAIQQTIQRPVRLVLQPDSATPDQAVVTFPAPADPIVADACRGPGLPVPGGIWPGSDARAARLLPPGCATATILADQVTEPADLLRARPLPPGAALPYARAIEAYYNRGPAADPASHPSSGGSGGGLSSPTSQTEQPPVSGWGYGSQANPAQPGQGQGAAESPGATNPLLGPVPSSH